IVRDAFCLDEIWDAIDALDYKVPSGLQTDMHLEIRNFLHHQTTWFLRNLPKPLDVANLIGRYRKGLEKLLNKPEGVLSPLELEDFKAKCSAYRSKGVPDGLARKVSAIAVMSAASDIVNVAESLDRKVQDVARAYFEVGNVVGFDWLRSTALTVMPDDHWDFLAIGSVVDDLADQQRELTRLILSAAKGTGGLTAVAKWRKAESATVFRTGRLLDDLRSSGAVTVAKLSYAARQCRSMLPLA
ncbi:MAG: hypothetical protein V3R73_00225, partial [Sphingomonadales bacterium]